MSIRSIRDAALVITKALPAAGANHNTDTLDLGSTNPGVTAEHFELEIAIPALPYLAADKTLTVTLQDSADDITYAAIATLATVVVTGTASTGGAAAKTVAVRLPSSVKRYVQANLAVASAGGDNTAKSVTLTPLF